MPISFLYGGAGDWMGPDRGRQLAKRLNCFRATSGPKIEVHLVPDAEHQRFLDIQCAETLLRIVELTH